MPYVEAAVAQGCLQVLINRPDKRNALSQAVLGELRECFASYANDQNIVIATITGAGDRCFAAGGDLHEFDSVRTQEQTSAMGRHSRAALDAVRDFPVPVVALLNGDAIGGGAELAVACDLRVFAAHSRMAFVQGVMCIAPAWGGGADLVRLAGPSRALRLLSRAEFISASLAFEFGLADAVASEGQTFSQFAAEFVAPILQRKPHVMRAFKQIVVASRRVPDEAGLRKLEAELLLSTWLHQDHWDAAEQVIARISGGAR